MSEFSDCSLYCYQDESSNSIGVRHKRAILPDRSASEDGSGTTILARRKPELNDPVGSLLGNHSWMDRFPLPFQCQFQSDPASWGWNHTSVADRIFIRLVTRQLESSTNVRHYWHCPWMGTIWARIQCDNHDNGLRYGDSRYHTIQAGQARSLFFNIIFFCGRIKFENQQRWH